MPVALLIIGAIFAVAAIRNTHMQLGQQLAGDLTGQGNFIYWIGAILVIGALGYVPPFRTPSRLLLGLILLVLFLSHGGIFDQFRQQLGSAQSVQPQTEPLPSGPPRVKIEGLGSTGGGGGSNIASQAAGILGGITKLFG